MASPEAIARRKAHQQAAAEIGVTEDYISHLVDTFYTRIRADSVLGPIFDNVIEDNWAPHLAKMKLFWSSVALSTGVYSGQPVPAHMKIPGLTHAHFERWLAMFEQTLRDTAPTDAAKDYFLERARRIAESLQLALFGLPGLQN